MRIDNQPPGRGRRCDARLDISANSASDFARHAVAALRRLGFRRAVWSASVDGIASPTWHRWLGTRVAIWPFGPPREPLRSIVSSRLPRALDTCPQWFERLRRELFAAATNGQRTVCVDGTAIATFLRHASATLGVRLLDVRHELPWGDLLSMTRGATRFRDTASLLSPSRDACSLWLTPCFRFCSAPW